MYTDSFNSSPETMSFFKSEGFFILKFALRKPDTLQLYIKFFSQKDTYRETVGKWPADCFKNGYIQPRTEADPAFFELKMKLDGLFSQARILLLDLCNNGICNRDNYLSRKRANQQSAYSYFEYVLDRDFEQKFFVESTKINYGRVLVRLRSFLSKPLYTYDRAAVLSLRAENQRNMIVKERLLRRLFTCAKNDGLIIKSPYEGVKPKKQKKRIYAGAVEKAEKIEAAYLAGAYSGFIEVYARMFIFSFQTGRRFSEVSELNKKDISQGYLHIIPKKTAGSTGEDVAQKLTALAQSCLGEPNINGFFFKNIQKPRFPTEHAETICRIAGVDYLNFHGARAVYATRFMRIPGTTISDLADMLCVDEQTALRYIQRDKKRANLLMEEFEKYN